MVVLMSPTRAVVIVVPWMLRVDFAPAQTTLSCTNGYLRFPNHHLVSLKPTMNSSDRTPVPPTIPSHDLKAAINLRLAARR